VPVNADVVISEPKTRRGHRSVTLDPVTVSVLKTWRQWQCDERLEWGPAWTNTGLVFTREDGTAYRPERITQMFASWSRRRSCRPSRCMALGTPTPRWRWRPAFAPRWSPSTSGIPRVALAVDVYSHAIPAVEGEAASRIAALVTGRETPNGRLARLHALRSRAGEDLLSVALHPVRRFLP
jgi:hypothetical protein